MFLSYSIREGIAGFRRAKFAVFTATSAMSVALVLIGLFLALGLQAHAVSSWLRLKVSEMELFLAPVQEPIAQALVQRANVTPGVRETEYITSRQAQAIFKEEFGEGADPFLSEPFLPASIRVRLDPEYAVPDSMVRLAAEFKSWNHVDEVIFNQTLLVKVQRNLRLLSTLGFVVGFLVIAASLFLVANTIRLTIYARRLLIRTMKLVGATDAFVQKPFLVEGIVQGLAAGLLAGLLLWILFGLMGGNIPQVSRPSIGAGFLMTFGLFVLGGVLGWAGSYLAVRRFIKKVALH